jgi:hypothetical protein
MAQLILEPTPTAQWQRLVQEASTNASRTLDEQLESYLVFLLVRCCAQTDILQRTMAVEYLHSLATQGRMRNERLRDVGDHCLLFAGLFPHIARKRLVHISYFVRLGRSAYQQLSEALNQSAARLYSDLSCAFVVLMDVLHSIRELQGAPCLSSIEAIDLLKDTGSERAAKALRRHTGAQPVLITTPIRRQ